MYTATITKHTSNTHILFSRRLGKKQSQFGKLYLKCLMMLNKKACNYSLIIEQGCSLGY